MPFTWCHPAIVLPLHRYAKGVTSLPALVIGSMMPDFVYFFSFGVSGSFSHSLPGLFLYCVPAGALVVSVYDTLLRQALLAWLPNAVSARLAWQVPRRWHSTRTGGIVLLSLAIGAATHIVWDGFTHPGTVFVNHFDVLRTLVPIGGHEIRLFNILQHVSSLLGFLAIAGCTLAWFSRTEPGPPPPLSIGNRHRLLALALVIAAAAAGGAWGMLVREATRTEHQLFNAITAAMASAAGTILLLCLAWQLCADKRIVERIVEHPKT